jgi:hypothetical protein
MHSFVLKPDRFILLMCCEAKDFSIIDVLSSFQLVLVLCIDHKVVIMQKLIILLQSNSSKPEYEANKAFRLSIQIQKSYYLYSTTVKITVYFCKYDNYCTRKRRWIKECFTPVLNIIDTITGNLLTGF